MATALACAAAVVVALRRGWHRRGRPADGGPGAPAPPCALVVWSVVLGAVGLVQLLTYLGQPRTSYPTLSWMASQAFGAYPARAAAYAAWLWLGWYLLDR